MTRREWLSGTIIGAQILLLAACGGDDEDDGEEPRAAPTAPRASLTQPKKERATLTVTAMYGGGAQIREAIRRWNLAELDGAAEDLELQEAGISASISGNLERDQAAFSDAINARISAGTTPDLVNSFWLLDFPWLFRSGLLQPLDQLIRRDGNNPMDRFFPQATQLVRFRQQTMALPTSLTGGVARYLPELFSEASVALPHAAWTRDEFANSAKQLTKDTDDDGSLDQWGFAISHFYPDWLPFVIHETGSDIIDLEATTVDFMNPAALRGLNFWDELGRVHCIMHYGPEIQDSQIQVRRPFQARRTGILFETAFEVASQDGRMVVPIPTGPAEGAPLLLFNVLGIPTEAQDPELSYRALVPLAVEIGEHSSLPTVKTSLQHISTPSRDHINLVFQEEQRETILNLLTNGQPSFLASSNYMNDWLLKNLTLPLARGEMDVAQAAQQAQEGLSSYISN